MTCAMYRFILAGLLWLGGVAATADGNHPALPLASGYGELAYTLPDPGSYRLPPLATAADGDVLLTSGATSRLYDLFADRLVLLSFIYTTCSDSNGCPLATVVLQRVQQALLDDPDVAAALRVISLSFDPAHDTPAVLQHYQNAVAGALPHWLFVTTPSVAALQPLLAAYGQNVLRRVVGQEESVEAHNLRVVLIDRARQVRNIYSVDFLHPDIIANDIKTLLLEEQGTMPPPPPAVATTVLGAGDRKDGYETKDYVTHSRNIRYRQGQAADLLALAKQPPLGLPPLSVPADNPLTPAKIALGRKLFFDRRLSLNDTISCAMCHIPEQGFAHNELATAVGFEGRTVRRNAPSLFNVGYLRRLFHDGRETSLETQVWQPLTAANEMANPSVGAVIEKIRHIPDYQGLFEQAFGRGPGMETVGMALASYQRTLNAADAPFDRWYYGKDESAVVEAVKRGFALFTGKAGCSGCHSVGLDDALFTDNTLHNTGIGWYAAMSGEPATRRVQLAPGVFVAVDAAIIAETSEPPPSDLGLYEVTQNPADRWRYKTPSLRNVALSAPYMHNGVFGTLEEVIDYYDRGGYQHALLDPLLHPLGLTAREKNDLLAFLQALTGATIEPLVRDAFAAPVGDLSAGDPHWSHVNQIDY